MRTGHDKGADASDKGGQERVKGKGAEKDAVRKQHAGRRHYKSEKDINNLELGRRLVDVVDLELEQQRLHRIAALGRHADQERGKAVTGLLQWRSRDYHVTMKVVALVRCGMPAFRGLC